MNFSWLRLGSRKEAAVAEAPSMAAAWDGAKGTGVGRLVNGSKSPEILEQWGVSAAEYKAHLRQLGFSEFIIQTERSSFHVPKELRAQAIMLEGQLVRFAGERNQGLEPNNVTSINPALN
jgi:hypothetical protein